MTRLLGLGLAALTAMTLAAGPVFPADTPDDWVRQCERLENNDPAAAITMADSVLENPEINDPLLLARTLACRGASLAIVGRLEEAIALVEGSLRPMIERVDDVAEHPRLLQRLGWIFFRGGDTEAAIEALTQSLALAETERITSLIPLLLGHLATYQGYAGLHELAIANHRRAIALLEPNSDREQLLPLHYNLGLTLRYQERYAEALEVLTPLLPELEAPGMEVRLASLLGVIGGVHRLLGDTQTARTLFERSASLHQQFDNPAERAALLRDMVRLSLELGETARALELAETAMALSERAQDFRSVSASMETMVDVLAETGDFRAALDLYRELSDRQNREALAQQNERLAELEAQLGLQRQAVELEQLRSEREIQALAIAQQKLRQRDTVYALLTLALIALGLLLWQRANNRRLAVIGRTDALTGLANRRHLTAKLKPDSHRLPGQFSVLILVDLDNFKRINDSHGHDVGDRALVAVSRFLEQYATEHRGVVGRWGGEEFCLLLPRLDRAATQEVAITLLAGLTALEVRNNQGAAVSISGSLGFAPLEAGPAHSGQEVWEPAFVIADQLLYRAKNGGRNRGMGLWPAAGGAALDPNAIDQQIASAVASLVAINPDETSSLPPGFPVHEADGVAR
jgi:diguanylate cyclase (GGDEF)-like protein